MIKSETKLNDYQINDLSAVLNEGHRIIDHDIGQFLIISTVIIPKDPKRSNDYILKTGLLTGNEAKKAQKYINDLIQDQESK
ncbi:MAG: hypothetical protein ROO71_08885 [Balneola sp.]